MGLTKVTEFLTKEPMLKWVDKKANLGREVDYDIRDVQMLDKDLVISIKEGSKEEEMLRVSATMKNDLIDHLGNDPRMWLDRGITIKYSEFKPKEGSKISEGVSTTLVWFEEEMFDNEPVKV